MRIAICDDNQIDRFLSCGLLRNYFANESIRLDLTEYDNGMNLIYDIEDGHWFDTIFLDIYMHNLLGIDVARRLRKIDYSGKIVFLTSSEEFAVDGYNVPASGYILKPVSYEKLSMTMERMLRYSDHSKYPIKQRNKIICVPLNEILFVESNNNKCVLHRVNKETYTIYKRLSEIEQELNDKRFLRCHQSYLVNMDYIQLASRQFKLVTGDLICIRQRDVNNICRIYLDYVKNKQNNN